MGGRAVSAGAPGARGALPGRGYAELAPGEEEVPGTWASPVTAQGSRDALSDTAGPSPGDRAHWAWAHLTEDPAEHMVTPVTAPAWRPAGQPRAPPCPQGTPDLTGRTLCTAPGLAGPACGDGAASPRAILPAENTGQRLGLAKVGHSWHGRVGEGGCSTPTAPRMAPTTENDLPLVARVRGDSAPRHLTSSTFYPAWRSVKRAAPLPESPSHCLTAEFLRGLWPRVTPRLGTASGASLPCITHCPLPQGKGPAGPMGRPALFWKKRPSRSRRAQGLLGQRQGVSSEEPVHTLHARYPWLQGHQQGHQDLVPPTLSTSPAHAASASHGPPDRPAGASPADGQRGTDSHPRRATGAVT